MMGCDPDMQSIDWADRMIMQIDPVTEDELSWRASYTEEMMRDLIDRAREISETTADPITQLPPLPGIGSQSISPTIPLGGAGSDVTHANTGGLNVPVGSTIQTDTLSSSVPYAPPSVIEEFGAGQPLEMVRDPEIREDSIDNVVRAPTLPATDFSQELRACYTREDDRDYSAAKKSALYSPLEDDSILRTDHRVTHAAALDEYKQTPERQVANSPYVRGMKYKDIANIIAQNLGTKGLAFWK
jgi:hypothetical protein